VGHVSNVPSLGRHVKNVPYKNKAAGEVVPPSNLPHRPDSARAFGLRARLVVLPLYRRP
jgi:hypothetical protein